MSFLDLVTGDLTRSRDLLACLDGWVRDVLAPVYLAGHEITPDSPWCPHWWLHPEARARLYALWLAWQELTGPVEGGNTGPSAWHRDHLDPCLAALRNPRGAFAACTTNPASPRHRQPEPLPVTPFLTDTATPAAEVAVTVVTDQVMRAALDTGQARPLAPGIPEFTRYRGRWWLADAGTWLPVTDGELAAELDQHAARLDTAAADLSSSAPGTPGG